MAACTWTPLRSFGLFAVQFLLCIFVMLFLLCIFCYAFFVMQFLLCIFCYAFFVMQFLLCSFSSGAVHMAAGYTQHEKQFSYKK